MRDKSLSSFSLLVSIAVKHFTRSDDDMNQLKAVCIKLYECVSVLALVNWQANCVFSAPYYIVIYGLLTRPYFSISSDKKKDF
jgi:hypothetical protein